jgi:muramoyltetrapeptide carboxypeptidase
MLMQLKLAGKFDGVHAVIFGEMLDCARNVQDYTLQDVVLRVVGDLGIPVAYGLKSGHVSRAAFTLPFGVMADFSAADHVMLTLGASVKSEATTVPVRTS